MGGWFDERAPVAAADRRLLTVPVARVASTAAIAAVTVSLSECRAGCRPLLDALVAKWGWRIAKRDDEAELHFTDIKRAGKRRCFDTVEAARQRRLVAAVAGALSSFSSAACVRSFPPRVNGFPGMAECVSKCALSRCLSFHQRLFPSDFDFFPVTYDLGSAAGLSDACAYLAASKGSRALIVKPSRGSQGAGIVLAVHVHQLQAVLYSSPNKRFVAQHYVDSALLGEYKFDLRVYVLVTGLKPLTLHVFHDGLARVCTEPYCRPTAVNLSHASPLSHLSNYSLNKHSFAFKPATEDQSEPPVLPTHLCSSSGPASAATVRRAAAPFATSPCINLDDVANKRSIRAALSQLAHQGSEVDVARFWAEVDEIAEKTLVAMTPALWSRYSATFKSAADESSLGSACFHLLGFDLLLDETLKVWLLEVNSAPSWATDSALDWRVKASVWENSMHLLGVQPAVVAEPATQRESDDEPLTARSVSSISSNVSSASSSASVPSHSSSAAVSHRSLSTARFASRLHCTTRLHSTAASARALRSPTVRRLSATRSACHDTRLPSSGDQRPPLPFDVPTFDWRDMRHTTASASASSCPHLHRALCHPQLLDLYHHHAHASGGLTPATFRRLIALFTSSAVWCTPLPAGDAHLLFLQHTKPRGESVLSFDAFCVCLAAVRQRYVHERGSSERQEAAVWEQWACDAHRLFVACVMKGHFAFTKAVSVAMKARTQALQ